MPPVMASPCSMDLWQLRSQSAISRSPTQADMMVRLDPEVPACTEYDRWAPNTRAAYFSLSPIGPLWVRSEPSPPRSIPMSVRKRFSP